jgi:uncharacterized repeat protein (TIGR03803 family)
VVRDSSGNLCGTTQNDGPNNAGTVFKVDQTGKKTVLWATFTAPHTRVALLLPERCLRLTRQAKRLSSFAGSTDGGSPQGGVIRDSHGNLYGTTYYGGNQGAGTVFKVNTVGQETVLHNSPAVTMAGCLWAVAWFAIPQAISTARLHKAAPTTSASCSRSIPRATKPCFTPSPEATAKPLRNPPPRQGGKPLWNYVRGRVYGVVVVFKISLINKQDTQKEYTT